MSHTVATTITTLRPYITAITMSLWPIFTAPTLQYYILSQQLLLRPYATATTMPPCSIFTALTSLGAILWQQLLRHQNPISQQLLCLYDLYFQLLRYNATYWLNNYYSGPILQQLLCFYDLYLQLLHYNTTYCLNNYYSDPISQQLLCLHDLYLQLLRHYDLYCRDLYYVTKAQYHSYYHVPMTHIYNSYVTMIHTVSTTIIQAL